MYEYTGPKYVAINLRWMGKSCFSDGQKFYISYAAAVTMRLNRETTKYLVEDSHTVAYASSFNVDKNRRER